MENQSHSTQPQDTTSTEQVALFGLRYIEKVRLPVQEDDKVMRTSQWMDPRDTGWIRDAIA